MENIEKALIGKPYQYVGYARSGHIYYIFRPNKIGRDWYASPKRLGRLPFFARTLHEINTELDSK